MSTPPPAARRSRALLPRLSRTAWLLIAAAIGMGLLLFLLLMRDLRQSNDFYRADGKPAGPGKQQPFEALPAPISGDPAGPAAPAIPPADAQVVAVEDIPVPQPAPIPVPAQPASQGALASGTRAPQPVDQRQPDYPAEALRNGESGTVLLRVTVGPDGFPYGIAIASSSRSRALDRAAMTAARRWRFSPALRDGAPTSETVEIPVVFNLPR